MAKRKANLTAAEAAELEIRALYEQYGYKKYKMGRFEEYNLYAANMDFITGDKVLTFTDLDGRLMAFKPDVTLSIIKDTNANIDSSERLYYIENVCREDREGRNFVEIEQMGLEHLGNVDEYGIAEATSLAVKTLRLIDPEYIFEMSHMSFVMGFLESLRLEIGDYVHFLNLIRRKNAPGIIKVAKKVGLPQKDAEQLAVIPTLFGPVRQTVRRASKLVKTEAMQSGLDQILRVYEIMRAMGAGASVQVDLSLVHDTVYYNGIIFRGFFRQLGRQVLSGGQYDEAMKKFGKQCGAIGFGLYLSELSQMAREKPGNDADVLLLYGKNEDPVKIAKAAASLRKQGLSVMTERTRPKGMKFGEVARMKNGELVRKEK